MTMLARDLMQTDLVTVDPDASLAQVQRLFLEEEIHGAPVVDEEGFVHGIISSMDLLRAVHDEYDSGAGVNVPQYLRDDLPYAGPDWMHAPEDFQDRLAELRASDAMVTELVTVRPDTPIAEVARTMRDQHIHRVLVVEDRQLCGLISTFDLIRLLEDRAATAARRGRAAESA